MKISVAPLLKQAVGERIELLIEERPIDPRGENAGLLDADITAVEADIRAIHTDPGALLQGDIHADVAQQCVRCLRPVVSPVDTTFAEQYYATLQVETGDPMPTAPRDAKVVGSDFLIDLTPLIREEVILATPQAPLHDIDCKGLCPVCGVDLNDSPHEHDQPPDERWGPLRRLAGLRVDDRSQ